MAVAGQEQRIDAYDRDRQKALDAGASEYLSKPLNGERLRQTLRELLSEE